MTSFAQTVKFRPACSVSIGRGVELASEAHGRVHVPGKCKRLASSKKRTEQWAGIFRNWRS